MGGKCSALLLNNSDYNELTPHRKYKNQATHSSYLFLAYSLSLWLRFFSLYSLSLRSNLLTYTSDYIYNEEEYIALKKKKKMKNTC